MDRYKQVGTYTLGTDIYSNRRKRQKYLHYTEIVIRNRTTLYELSMEFYKTSLLFWVIMEANDILEQEEILEEGRKVKIPLM